MATLASVRTALDNKIWNAAIARTVTVHNISGSTVDDRGQVFYTWDSGTSVGAVPYNTFSYMQDNLEWGTPDENETDMVFRYDTTLTRDSIVVDSTLLDGSYEVREIEKYPFGDGYVAIVARLTKQL